MEKIKELVIGRVTEEKVNEETGEKEVTVIKAGKNLKAIGSFYFTEMADEFYSKKNEDGNKEDGVTTIYNELLFGNELGLIKFWHCITANYPNTGITKEDIIQELQKQAELHGLKPLFKGALDVFTMGFYQDKIEEMEFMTKIALKKEKNPEKKAELESSLEMMDLIKERAIS